jgi:hypothetical protein
MGERLVFKCWNCGRVYSLYREITKGQTLIVACPFCNAEAVVDLAPYLKQKKHTLRSSEEIEQYSIEEFDLPEILPTKKKPSD